MIAVLSRQGGRRYCQVGCAIVLLASSTSQGSGGASAPPQTVAHRRYPQSSYAGNGSAIGVRAWDSTSLGSPAGGSSGSGGGFSRCPVVNNSMEPLKQNTARNLMILMVDSTDHITGKDGLTLTITVSKDGGAMASISPSVTPRTAGWYNLAMTASHTDTLGDLAFHITGTGADPCDFKLPVEVERTGLLGATGIQAIWDALTSALTTVGSIGKLCVDNINATISSRAPEAAGNVAAIKAVTDQLTAAQTEPAAVPASNASPLAKLGWLFMLGRNRITETASAQKVRNDANNADVGTSAQSDDGTTYTRGVWS